MASEDKDGELLAELHRWRKLRKAAIFQQLKLIKELLKDLKMELAPGTHAAAAADAAVEAPAAGGMAAKEGKSKASNKAPAPAKKERPPAPIHSEF